MIDRLVPGQYVLTVSLPGFETLTREFVTAGADEPPLRLVLGLSSVQDSVVVRGTVLNYANAIAAKRADDRIVDAFGADEIPRSRASAGSACSSNCPRRTLTPAASTCGATCFLADRCRPL